MAALQEAAWAIASGRDEFGYAEIAVGLKISRERAVEIVRGWLKQGLLAQVKDGTVGKGRSSWRLREGVARPVPPRLRTPEGNLWTAMRGLRSFTPRDLAAHANVPDVEVTEACAQDYCRALLDAGYLAVIQKADAARRRPAIYRLVRMTGPRAPRVKRVRAVIDDNDEAVHVIGRVE
jgi:hypothetical protein